jgi:hypothetical protein
MHGRRYDRIAIAAKPIMRDIEEPERYWTPSISPGGNHLDDRFPQ